MLKMFEVIGNEVALAILTVAINFIEVLFSAVVVVAVIIVILTVSVEAFKQYRNNKRNRR